MYAESLLQGVGPGRARFACNSHLRIRRKRGRGRRRGRRRRQASEKKQLQVDGSERLEEVWRGFELGGQGVGGRGFTSAHRHLLRHQSRGSLELDLQPAESPHESPSQRHLLHH